MQTWMHAMKELDDRPLRELVIPGSHDAGTFVMEHRIDNNSSKCQEISILEQLKAGSRYLDLRAWKASDGEYWLYHGKVWTHVKLADALADIKTFLDQSTGEIVIATLLIDDKTNIDAGWQWACKQVKDYMATPSVVNGKSFADVTLRQFRDARKRLVLLRSGAVSQLTCMDREGVWGNSLEPSDYVKALDDYRIWSDKMWILHLGIPYKGEIHNTMPTRAEWNAKEFVPRLKGEKPYES
jgi:Phosphatidylinositol-specific phospholipase C, X domain